jgi:glycolate oxidase
MAATFAEQEILWGTRRNISPAIATLKPKKINEDIVVPAALIPEMVSYIEQLAKEFDLCIVLFGHFGDGNIHTNLMVENYDDPRQRERAHAALDILFAWVLENGGAITGEHGVGLAKLPWVRQALGPLSIEVHRAVKNALDPHNILNPGKLLG